VLLRNRLPGLDLSSKEHAAAALIEVLRAIPPRDETVSLDCLVTTIQRVPPHVRIKYERYGTAEMSVRSRAGTFTLLAAFTPWDHHAAVAGGPSGDCRSRTHPSCVRVRVRGGGAGPTTPPTRSRCGPKRRLASGTTLVRQR
jgi:hypothetical protein